MYTQTQIPHLTTALSGPLQYLEKKFLQNQIAIESWFRQQWRQTPPPFYSSMDLRNAGFKLAPVDTNLFPAGFNNLNPNFMSLCVQAVQATMTTICPELKKVLIIPENHTRNIFYLENLATLQEILTLAGFETRIGSLIPDLPDPQAFSLPSKRKLILEQIIRNNDQVSVEEFAPCALILNNDLSDGVPKILTNLTQTIMPSTELGWFKRLKSEHFQHYKNVSNVFANKFKLDPWLISPLFYNCGEIDFLHQAGLEQLAAKVETLFNDINKKYKEYNIKQQPFVVVKADAGTYGMAVLMIKDAKEILDLNRKKRINMATTKSGQQVTKVIIQEGVYTFETWGEDQHVAEPVVYMIGQHVVGGFYRIHSKKGINENLNSPGMFFEPLAFAEACNCPDCNHASCTNRFYSYGVIARLAALAAAQEIKTLNEN